MNTCTNSKPVQDHLRKVLVEGDCETLEGWVKRDADLDGMFTLWDIDTGEPYRVKGWMVTVHHDGD